MFCSIAGGGVLGELAEEGEKTGRDGGLKRVRLLAFETLSRSGGGGGRRKREGFCWCRWLGRNGRCVGSK